MYKHPPTYDSPPITLTLPTPPICNICPTHLKMLPHLELFGVRDADAVDPLQRLSIGLPLSVGGGFLCDPVSLDRPHVAHVRPPAEVDQWTTAVDSGPGFCDLVTNDMALELIVLHHKRKKRGRAIGASLQHTSLKLDCI